MSNFNTTNEPELKQDPEQSQQRRVQKNTYIRCLNQIRQPENRGRLLHTCRR